MRKTSTNLGISYHRLKKEETETDSQEATKVENNDEAQGAEASGSSWWGMDYSSLLNKAVNTVSTATASAAELATTATASAAELAKQKVSFSKCN